MSRKVPKWKQEQDAQILASGGDPTAPPGDMRRLGKVRRVYSILSLFVDQKIREYDAINESLGEDGQPDWATVRVSDGPGNFRFLQKQDFFFDKAEAVAFAERALRAHAVYVGTFFGRLQAEQDWARGFRNKTTEYITRELIPEPPKAKGKR